MQKSKSLKILALVLSATMIFSLLAACGSDDPREFQQPPANWDEPYEDTVSIIAAGNHGTNWYFFDGDDVNNNPWIRLYKEKLNIDVSFEWTAVDDYITRLNLAISSGALPDVFYIPREMDPRVFYQLVNDGALLDLTDAYTNYASPRIRAHEQADPDTIQGFIVDGKLYGVPKYYYGQIDQPWHMWVRKDWYEAAGSPQIRTVDDLENLARTFMSTYGGHGILVDRDLQWLYRTAPMFGAYVGEIAENQYFWIPDDTGRIRPGISFPEFKVALERWQSWYNEGIISPDFMTYDPWGNAWEEIYNGNVGIQCWWQWWGWMGAVTSVAMNGDDAYFVPLNLPTLDGNTPAKGQIFYPNTGVIVASSDFKNPAALMKVLSLIDHMVFSPDAGLSQEDLYIYMEEGREHCMTATFQVIDPLSDMLQYQHVLYALETGDTDNLFTTGMKFKYSDSLAWIDNKEPHGLGAYLQMGFDGSAYARSQHLFDIGSIIQTEMWGPAPQEFDQVGTVNDIIQEGVVSIVTGQRPVSDFDDILAQWYAQGGQIMEDAINKDYGG